MNEKTLQNLLADLLAQVADMDAEDLVHAGLDDELADIVHVRSFADAGILSGNAGVVLATEGREFQITIVRSH